MGCATSLELCVTSRGDVISELHSATLTSEDQSPKYSLENIFLRERYLIDVFIRQSDHCICAFIIDPKWAYSSSNVILQACM